MWLWMGQQVGISLYLLTSLGVENVRSENVRLEPIAVIALIHVRKDEIDFRHFNVPKRISTLHQYDR